MSDTANTPNAFSTSVVSLEEASVALTNVTPAVNDAGEAPSERRQNIDLSVPQPLVYGTPKYVFYCKLCPLVRTSQASLVRHVCTTHKDINGGKINKHFSVKTYKQALSCDKCKRKFATIHRAATHMPMCTNGRKKSKNPHRSTTDVSTTTAAALPTTTSTTDETLAPKRSKHTLEDSVHSKSGDMIVALAPNGHTSEKKPRYKSSTGASVLLRVPEESLEDFGNALIEIAKSF